MNLRNHHMTRLFCFFWIALTGANHDSLAQSRTDTVFYDHSSLSLRQQQTIYVRDNPASPTTCQEVIRNADLYVKLDLGEDYEYGDHLFGVKVALEVFGLSTFSGPGDTILRFDANMMIDEEKPEALRKLDFRHFHPLVNRFEIVVSGYSAMPAVASDVRLFAFVREKTGIDASAAVVTIVPIGAVSNANPQVFEWTSDCEQTPNYQFQLLRLFNVDPEKTTEQDITALIDWNKALLLETETTHLKLTLAEGTGYYIWRVRAIGNYYEGGVGNADNWGEWSATPGFNQGVQSIAAAPSFGFFYHQFDHDMIWRFQRGFSPQTRIREGITYSDGLGQTRQSQGNEPYTQTTIVSQNLYDYNGRNAWLSMAAPLDQGHFEFRPGLLQTSGGGLYSVKDFDADHNYQDPEPLAGGPFHDFYSDNNPDIRIPNAGGFPFSRTLFYSDGSERILESSSPGAVHRLGSQVSGTNRTVKNLYSGVADIELVRLFGDEAPAAKTVIKEITIDPNKRSTVVYRSKSGQPLASCFAVLGDTLMEPLPTAAGGTFQVVDSSLIITPMNGGLKASKTLAFAEPTALTLDYEITPNDIRETCTQYCQTCDYRVVFTISRLDDPYDPNFPVRDEILIPADTCLARKTTFVKTYFLQEPGSYLVERDLIANTNDPNSITPANTFGYSYFDRFRQRIDSILTAQVDTFLDTLYYYIDHADINGLNAYLGADPQVDSVVTIATGCFEFEIPVEFCDTFECDLDSPRFEQYLVQYWEDSTGRTSINEYMPAFLDHQFDSLIRNMLTDPVDPYACEDLWKCWIAVVQNYFQYLEMDAASADYDFNMLEAFLNCTGRRYRGFVPPSRPFGPDFANPGYLSHAYAFFAYDHTDPRVECENVYCASAPCPVFAGTGYFTFSGFTSDSLFQFYSCLNSLDVTAPTPTNTDILNTVEGLEDSCRRRCTSRFSSFKFAIIAEYEALGYRMDATNTFMAHPFDPAKDITIREIECSAWALVYNCMGNCDLTVNYSIVNPGTIVSVGNEAELEAMQAAMLYAFEISIPKDTLCPDSFDLVFRGAELQQFLLDFLNDGLEASREQGGGYFKLPEAFIGACTPPLDSVCVSVDYPSEFLLLGCDLVYVIHCLDRDIMQTVVTDFCLDSICCPAVCFRWMPAEIPLGHVFEPLSCEEMAAAYLGVYLDHQAAGAIDAKLEKLDSTYASECLDRNNINDRLILSYSLSYHHYSLSYYDRAGRVIKTVPPKGVDLSSSNRDQHPNHRYITEHRYNSLGQLIHTKSPDRGEMAYFHDRNGRLRFSQDSRMKATDQYAYIRYDRYNRIVETGISDENPADFASHTDDMSFPITGTERTWSVYSKPAPGVAYLDGRSQRNIYNKLSYTYTEDDVYTYFSYDLHANYEWVIRELPGLGRTYLRTEFNVFTGKPDLFTYNEGRADQFFHRYTYDINQRVEKVETSTDGEIWDTDITYEHHLDDQLRRVMLGEDKLQGIDFTYTLLGSLKGINHGSDDRAKDPGEDGRSASPNAHFPGDVYGQTLNYYDGDFNRAGSPFNTTDAFHLAPERQLYDGNIAGMVAHTAPNPTGQALQYEQLTGHRYRYDQLGRLIGHAMQYHDGSAWQKTSDYAATYAYDPNGNLTHLERNGYAGHQLPMDQLTYHYDPNTNRLNHVDDAIDPAWYRSDIDDQAVDNYRYDDIGNLTKDQAADIDTIEWTARSLIKRLVKRSTGDTLEFVYDGNGLRVMKIFKPGRGGVLKPALAKGETTYYVYDVNGALISVYRKYNRLQLGNDRFLPPPLEVLPYKPDPPRPFIQTIVEMVEQPIYGSGRIGVRTGPVVVQVNGKPVDKPGPEVETVEYLKANHHTELKHLFFPLWRSTGTFSFSNKIKGLEFEDGAAPVLQLFNSTNQWPGENIAVAEDELQNVQVVAYTPSSDQVNFHTAVVFDSTGAVMPGGRDILSYSSKNSIIVRKPGPQDRFYLFTVDYNRQLYYHEIDMALPGNGTSAIPQGEVISKNNPLDLGTSTIISKGLLANTYGSGMVAAALCHDTVKVFFRKFSATKPDAGEVIGYTITASGFSPPQIMAYFPSVDPEGHGEMQLSPDGRLLAIANVRSVSGVTRGELRLWKVGNRLGSLSPPASYVQPKGFVPVNLDFSPAGQYLYYTANTVSASFPWAVNRLNLNSGASQNQLRGKGHGDIRRGKDGKMYFAETNKKHLKVIGNPDDPVTDIAIFNVAGGNHKLTGGLPLQVHKTCVDTILIAPVSHLAASRQLDHKNYEIKDHLGNVRVVTSDRKLSTIGPSGPEQFEAEVLVYFNYYAYGMLQPGRHYNSADYRFAYNGMEKDDDIKGLGNSYTTEFRQYDPRLGRWLSFDPASVADWSPYAGMDDNPVITADPRGDVGLISTRGGNISAGAYSNNGPHDALAGIEWGIGANVEFVAGANANRIRLSAGMYVTFLNPVVDVSASVSGSVSFNNEFGEVGAGLKNVYVEAIGSPSITVAPSIFRLMGGWVNNSRVRKGKSPRGKSFANHRSWGRGYEDILEHDWTPGANNLYGLVSYTFGLHQYADSRGTTQRTGFMAFTFSMFKGYYENDGGLPLVNWGDEGDRFRSTRLIVELDLPFKRWRDPVIGRELGNTKMILFGYKFFTGEFRKPGDVRENIDEHNAVRDPGRGGLHGVYTDRTQSGEVVLGSGSSKGIIFGGISYIGRFFFADFNVGVDAEGNRKALQNKFAHDNNNLPWVPLNDRRNKPYLQGSIGTGAFFGSYLY